MTYFLSEKSEGAVSDTLPCSGRTAGQEVSLVCLLCPVMKEAREPSVQRPGDLVG